MLSGLVQFLREPFGLHLKAIALGGLLWTWNWQWLLLLVALALALSTAMFSLASSQSRKDLARLVPILEQPNYWRRPQDIGSPEGGADWKSTIARHVGVQYTGQSTVLLTPRDADGGFHEPEVFLNALGPSVILLPNGYDTAKPSVPVSFTGNFP